MINASTVLLSKVSEVLGVTFIFLYLYDGAKH